MHRTNALSLSILSLVLMGGACTWSPEQNVNNTGAAAARPEDGWKRRRRHWN